MQDKKQILGIISFILILIFIMFIFISLNKNNTEYNNTPGYYDTFAQCVADYGLSMYGAEWCTFCAKEKKELGNSFRLINYIECPENIQLCLDKEIEAYPTWSDKANNKFVGFQGPSGLARITNCELPK